VTELNFKITGLDEAVKALQAAFPKDPKQQVKILNSSMRTAARPTILKEAKMLAKAGDGSGALSQAVNIRSQSKRKIRAKGDVAAGIEIVPVRGDKKAIAMYLAYYYTNRGKVVPAKTFASGIRHGHLVEFGTRHSAARPFLWPAAQHGRGGYIARFAADMRRKIETAVKRAAKRRK